MDLQKTILYAALGFTLLMIWQAWQEDYGPKPAQVETVAQSGDISTTESQNNTPAVPELSQTTPVAPVSKDAPSVTGQPAMSSAKRIKITTDVIHAEIDTTGGDLRKLDLLAYPVEASEPDNPFRLLDDSGELLFVAQAALLPAAGSNSAAPNHHEKFLSAKAEYLLAEGEDELQVPLVWEDTSGIRVTKTYTFKRGSYDVKVDFKVENSTEQPWRGFMYRQLQRNRPADSMSSFGIYTYTGGVLYTEEEKYEKIDFDDMEKSNLSRTATGGWVAMIQHYFLGAWVPDQQEENSYYTKSPGNDRYIIGSVGGEVVVPKGENGTFSATLFVGPKLQEQLEAIAPGLELAVDYGILTIIAKPLFWLLKVIYDMVGNWGWAIILLTVLIKAVFYKLSEASYKSMAHMRKVQPRLQALKEQYAGDREKLNQAMMRMYKEEKINPLGGCLPILVQIPVFIALYWMLLESVEMRQAPFALWLTDLSSPDPYYVLPILMGATMLVQHRLNPTPLDPIQARVMMILPVVFTFFFLWFPAGLVLYWVVNNALSIAQQWYITRIVIKS